LPSTLPCELRPCSAVATSPSATITATPQSTSVRRGCAAHARASRSVKPTEKVLLHRDRLGQVARLVDVEAAQPSDAIGEQLQRALERDRKADVAAEVEEERRLVEALCDRLDRVVALQEVLHLLRQLVQPVEDEVDLVRGQRPPDLGEPQREQAEQRHLGGE